MAILIGSPSADLIYGTEDNDRIAGMEGNDTLYGFGGSDVLTGADGNDSLIGGLARDTLYGGWGHDTLNAVEDWWDSGESLLGEMGDDVYQVDSSLDDIIEDFNEGSDTVRSRVSYILGANVENLVLTEPIDINGSGNSHWNRITGSSGNNYLTGNEGQDTLSGNSGNDTLSGGAGYDTLTGGIDKDQFLFNTALPDAGIDTINDFLIGADKIVLDRTVFAALETVAGGPLMAADILTIRVSHLSEADVARECSEEIVYNSHTGHLFYNPNNAAYGFGTNGGQFATIVGEYQDNLSYHDFLVVA